MARATIVRHRSPTNREPAAEVAPPAPDRAAELRIIGGQLRGRRIVYSGDPRVRPMKDNVRQAMFDLVGGYIAGTVAFDLFAGTGAVGFEALSRGAVRAFLIERHFPTARIIETNARSLQVEARSTIVTADAFFWTRQFLADRDQWPNEPWSVFCCPPYELYERRPDELQQLVDQWVAAAPPASLIVVESTAERQLGAFPRADEWRHRQYRPATISVWRNFVATP